MLLKQRKDKKKTVAVDAVGEKGVFTGGGKYAGKVRLTRSISLAESATGKKGKVSTRVTKSAEGFSPADRAAKRAEKKADEPQLARKLTAIAAAVRPGRSAIGAAISGGLSGAAIGATIGEEISAHKRRKAKKRKGNE